MYKKIMYVEAYKTFFDLEVDQIIVIEMPKGQLLKFRDSLYKLARRYKEYGKLYRTKFINPKKLKIWRIK